MQFQQQPNKQVIRIKGLVIPTSSAHRGRLYACPTCEGRKTLRYLLHHKGPDGKDVWIRKPCHVCHGAGKVWI